MYRSICSGDATEGRAWVHQRHLLSVWGGGDLGWEHGGETQQGSRACQKTSSGSDLSISLASYLFGLLYPIFLSV